MSKRARFQVHRMLKVNPDIPLLELTAGMTRIRDLDEVWRVFENAAQSDFDETTTHGDSESEWHLREPYLFEIPLDGSVIKLGVLKFARRRTKQRANVVTDDSIETRVIEPENPSADVAHIILYLDREIALIEERSGFTQKGAAWKSSLHKMLVKSAHDLTHSTELRLEPIPAPEEADSVVGHMSEVTKVKLSLVMPNPDHSSLYEALEQSMIASNIGELRMEMKAKDGGLDLREEAGLASQGISMAQNGYKKDPIEVEGKDLEGHELKYVSSEGNVAVLEEEVPSYAASEYEQSDIQIGERQIDRMARRVKGKLAGILMPIINSWENSE